MLAQQGAPPVAPAAAAPPAAPAPANLPLWAYGYAPPGTPAAPATPAAPDDGSLKTLQGSAGKFTLTQVRDGFGPADWHPGDHPPMPEIVARGRKDGNIRACALCHYPNGKGRAENAPVSGLPASYFVQQMHDYRDGVRKSADPKKGNTIAMAAIAKAPIALSAISLRFPVNMLVNITDLPGPPFQGAQRASCLLPAAATWITCRRTRP